MITLYTGSGSTSLVVQGPAKSPDEWVAMRKVAVALLAKRNQQRAASLLETCGFEIHQGTNDFGDEFCVLFRTVSLDEYVQFESYSTNPSDRTAFGAIAKTVTELGPFIRFIAVALSTTGDPQPVTSPAIARQSAVVERALIDAEQLIRSSGAISAVDRVHTALHGYLRDVCVEAGLMQRGQQCTANEALKRIREHHPRFVSRTRNEGHSDRILKAMGAVTDALGTIRNNASVAHPNQDLLEEPEAMLAINAARTILHFIHSRMEI